MKKYPSLTFRSRTKITKKEINEKLHLIDSRLGQVLFVEKSNIQPDGGIIEVRDRFGKWRIVLIGESKHQGNDIEKIAGGIKQGKNKDKDLMVAGNAIERVHKNIQEFKNIMLDEQHFPYVVFLQGSNFSTNTFFVTSPDGRQVEIAHDAGGLNRIDRVTASNFSMPINTNYCKNIILDYGINNQILQATSLYFQCSPWSSIEMYRIMLEIAETSLEVLSESLPSLKLEVPN